MIPMETFRKFFKRQVLLRALVSFIFLISFSHLASAQGSIEMNLPQNPSATLAPSSQVETKNSEVSFRSESFISPNFNSKSENNFGFVGAKYNNIDASKGAPILQADISGLFSPQQPVMSYLNVNQFFIDAWGLQFGRKRANWSLLDEEWHLGFFQPQFRWNALLPESQGLTGFFLSLRNEDKQHPMGIRFFGSFLYLPDQSSSYQIKNGDFQSVNPWFPQMPSQIQFDGLGSVTNKLNWSIQTPETTKVLFNSSYMTQLYYGREHKNFYLAASAGYKPSNQLLMAVDSATLSTGQTNVTIYPEIYYHTVGAIDLRYSFTSLYYGISFLSEKPSEPESIPSQLNYRIYNSKQMYSPILGFKGGSFEASLSYLDVEGKSDFVTGPQSEVLANYLPQQTGYGNAWQAQISYTFGRQFLPGLKLSSTYLQGANDDFALWNSTGRYQLNKQWSLDGSVLLVRAESSSVTASLFQQYQNNDLVTLGANYAF